jgi:single-strand DNA-binding protein
MFRDDLDTVRAHLTGYVVLNDNKEVPLNVVTLIGNLATDVDVREVGEGRKVASFTLAVDRPGQDDKADFVRIATWNRLAEVCARFLTKGKRVAVDGRLRSRSWDDADGNRRSAIEIVANSVQFLSPPDKVEPATADIPFEGAAAS